MNKNNNDRSQLSELATATLELMATRPEGFPSSELQAALGMHGDVRTIRRALRELEEKEFARPTGATKGRVWKAIKPIPSSRRPTVNESIALLTLRHLAYRHLPSSVVRSLEPDFAAAEGVLQAHPTASNLAAARLWMDKTARLHGRYPLIAPSIREDFFEIVGHALYNDESLDITYRTSLEAEPKQYRAMPHALIEKGPLWYLVVKNRRNSGKPATPIPLRMDRIVDVKPAGIDLPRDKSFSLDKFIRQDRSMEFFPGDPVQIRLRVREIIEDGQRVEHAFRSLKLSPDQTIEDLEGGFMLTATIVPSVPLTNLLLEKSTTVDVISPLSMRQDMISRLKRALAQYEEPLEVLDVSGRQPSS
ncbi:helix-turn-helix transcriptional regulator [Cupriavidus oxalaticus]|uniref:WYL domain-containing protein n=1 Tax=Cupriavidus oxalaticus TaxID=96344 RepID=A0A4P7LH41_9BURK|nr:WYL domain-containing protein [Cupriavidus oxalaticus]QBY55534.1 WYL domain-containing protein [Cupriavidus oxalaticus]